MALTSGNRERGQTMARPVQFGFSTVRRPSGCPSARKMWMEEGRLLIVFIGGSPTKKGAPNAGPLREPRPKGASEQHLVDAPVRNGSAAKHCLTCFKDRMA